MRSRAKNNIRSFRYSDEVAAILEAQQGDSLNDKFEKLVLTCFYKLEQRQKDLEAIEEQIRERREKLYSLQDATRELAQLEKDINSAKHYFGIVERRAQSIAESEL